MAGFDDLVAQAQPRLVNAQAAGVPGRDWSWRIDGFVDFAGDAVDLTGCTFECKCVDAAGTVLFDMFTVAGELGALTVTASAADTAAATNGGKRTAAYWMLSMSNGSQVIQVWGPEGSPFQFEWVGA